MTGRVQITRSAPRRQHPSARRRPRRPAGHGASDRASDEIQRGCAASASSRAKSAPGRPSPPAPLPPPAWTRPGTPSSTSPDPTTGTRGVHHTVVTALGGGLPTAPAAARRPGRRPPRRRARRARPRPAPGHRRGAPPAPRPAGGDQDPDVMRGPRLCRRLPGKPWRPRSRCQASGIIPGPRGTRGACRAGGTCLLRRRRRGPGQGLLLELEVGVDVRLRRPGALVPHPEGDRDGIDPGVQQGHGRGMPQGVRGDVFVLDGRAARRRGRDVPFDQVPGRRRRTAAAR